MHGPGPIWCWRSRRRLQRKTPLISLVLGVKNGLPALRNAIDAVRRQTYRKFELVVQDGASTDGSLEYLQAVTGLPRINVASQRDSGIGQAYNRGLARCKGDIVCILSCDEWLDDDALQRAVDWFAENPNAAVIYGAVRLVDENGRLRQVFFPPAFDRSGVIHNEIVPPISATFMGRAPLAKHLYYDESLTTCPDYDLWLRVGAAFAPDRIVVKRDPIVSALSDRTSMSFRVESFDQFCRDKLFILDRFLSACHPVPDPEQLRKTASAGIFTWAAENIVAMEGPSPAFLDCCAKAAVFEPQSPRLLRLARQTLAFEMDPAWGFRKASVIQPLAPGCPVDPMDAILHLDELESLPHWEGAAVERGESVHVVTRTEPWSYAAQMPVHPIPTFDAAKWYWVALDLEVLAGEVGIALLLDDTLVDEQRISPSARQTRVFLRLRASPCIVMIRNGALPGASAVRILHCTTGSCLRRTACSTGLS